jgi:hypothetical protein
MLSRHIAKRHFSFAALIQNYEERKYIVDRLERINEGRPTYHARMRTRIAYFIRSKKRRFVYLFLILLGLNVIDGALKVLGSRTERAGRKYKKAIIR